MKFAINMAMSLGMLVLCLIPVWPNAETRTKLGEVMRTLDTATFLPAISIYLFLMLIIHACRCWRWNNLLAPLGIRIGYGRLWAVSSVGFMAILALPARLGEFVRPALLRKDGEVSASAALGTVLVERVIDGLCVSLFVFGAFFALRGPNAPTWMMPTAYAALAIFGGVLVFVLFSQRWPEGTVDFALRVSLLRRVWPRAAFVLRMKLLEMVRGFGVLRDVRQLTWFMLWSFTYWACNGLCMWVLAHGMGLPLSMLGAFATMAFLAVGIGLPNAPGLAGQFHAFMLAGLSLYLGPAVLQSNPATDMHVLALAFAIIHHLLQVIWYVGMGMLGIATKHVSFADLRRKKVATD